MGGTLRSLAERSAKRAANRLQTSLRSQSIAREPGPHLALTLTPALTPTLTLTPNLNLTLTLTLTLTLIPTLILTPTLPQVRRIVTLP